MRRRDREEMAIAAVLEKRRLTFFGVAYSDNSL
jgi:hypothetical protein